MNVAQIMDSIQECLLVKTGMYLNYEEIKNILKNFQDDLSVFLLENAETNFYRFRPEEIEYVINSIRESLGELLDTNPYPMISLLKEHPEYQEEMLLASQYSISCMDWHRKKYGVEKPLGEEFINKLMQDSRISRRVADLFMLTMFQSLDRSFSYSCSTKCWDGVVALSDLFNSEVLPTLPDVYFDQRYIDYLSNNTDDLFKIHWRQFEALNAEFFSRNGFDVKLGPGRKDGGIDVFATHKETNYSIIIQCKRYSKGNLVEVNAVKALCFDVIDKGADMALLSTTSHICPDGKDITTRNYPISAVEHENIIEWVKSMRSETI